MPRSTRDQMKRSCAQAVNHLAHSVIDLNSVYEEFTQAAEKVRALALEAPTGAPLPDANQYDPQIEELRLIMLGVNAARERVLKFALDNWAIDEEGLMRHF